MPPETDKRTKEEIEEQMGSARAQKEGLDKKEPEATLRTKCTLGN